MILQDIISSQSAYNTWANENIIKWLKQQDLRLLDKETISSFSTINFTIQHMLRTQRFWLSFVSDEDVSRFNWSVRKDSIERIMDDFIQQSKEMQSRFELFEEDELATILSLNMSWATNALPRYKYIMHVINHSTFHRGQIITMARALGMNDGIPATDYNIFNCL